MHGKRLIRRCHVETGNNRLAPISTTNRREGVPRRRALISPTSIKEPVTQTTSDAAAECLAMAKASEGVVVTCANGASCSSNRRSSDPRAARGRSA